MRSHLSKKVVVGLRSLPERLLDAGQIGGRIGPILKRSKGNHNANLTGKLNDNSI